MTMHELSMPPIDDTDLIDDKPLYPQNLHAEGEALATVWEQLAITEQAIRMYGDLIDPEGELSIPRDLYETVSHIPVLHAVENSQLVFTRDSLRHTYLDETRDPHHVVGTLVRDGEETGEVRIVLETSLPKDIAKELVFAVYPEEKTTRLQSVANVLFLLRDSDKLTHNLRKNGDGPREAAAHLIDGILAHAADHHQPLPTAITHQGKLIGVYTPKIGS